MATADLFASQYDLVFFAKDVEGRYIAVSESLMERCGLATREELIGRTVRDVFPAELAARYAMQDREVTEKGRRITERLELHLYPHRRSGWCLTSKEPLRSASGEICGLVGISRDLPTLSSAQSIPASLVSTLDSLEADVSSIRLPIDLAHRAGLSPSRFARLIKRIFRVPPSQLLAHARAAAALRLLTETDQSVGAIAHACGYYDQSAFTRAFRSTVGVSPTDIRKRQR
jgi:PAS domain S-box-containing protein